MNSEILTDIGENYEYVRTIVGNKIELFKIETAEKSGKLIGGLVTALLIGSILSVVGLILTIILVIYLASLLGSWLIALSILIIFLLSMALILWVFRKTLIMNPISNLIFELILDDDE